MTPGLEEAQAIQLLQLAVTRSNMLKLSKCKTKLKRRIPFNEHNIDKELMDTSTVYVENFPPKMDHLAMAKLFQRAGTIRNITLPTYVDKQLKGFCFVEFASPDAAAKACQLFDNVVPEEFINLTCKNYIDHQSESVPHLKVISKVQWLNHKQTLKDIKNELRNGTAED